MGLWLSLFRILFLEVEDEIGVGDGVSGIPLLFRRLRDASSSNSESESPPLPPLRLPASPSSSGASASFSDSLMLGLEAPDEEDVEEIGLRGCLEVLFTFLIIASTFGSLELESSLFMLLLLPPLYFGCLFLRFSLFFGRAVDSVTLLPPSLLLLLLGELSYMSDFLAFLGTEVIAGGSIFFGGCPFSFFSEELLPLLDFDFDDLESECDETVESCSVGELEYFEGFSSFTDTFSPLPWPLSTDADGEGLPDLELFEPFAEVVAVAGTADEEAAPDPLLIGVPKSVSNEFFGLDFELED